MNAFVRKEVRLLLPNFIIGLLLAFSVLVYADVLGEITGFRIWFAIVPTVLCPALVVMLALDSFGRELNAGTFSNLLAQPMSRQKIWRTKTSLLAAGIALIWCVWIVCFSFSYVLHGDGHGDWLEAVMGSGLFALAVFAGGLWTVLLFRQVAAAFWFTVLTPGVLLIVIQGLLEGHPKRLLFAKVVIGVGYSVTGFLFARWLFLRAQDVQWTGGTIVLPEMRGLARFKSASGVRRTWRPRVALLFKEFQLHQSQFVLAGVLALLHLGVILWRHLKSDLAQHGDLEFILNIFWGLWLVMPFLVGCAAVAEERKLGTLESQLGLPVKRRTQFVIKLAVALILSVLLGAVMPLLLEGNKILPGVIPHIDPDNVDASVLMPGSVFGQTMINLFFEILVRVSPWMPLIILAAISSCICALAFYASSLARNTLQSLGPAVLGILIAWFLLFGAFHAEEIFNYPLWRGWLIYLIGVPVMALALVGLAFWNYKRALVGWNVWRRNLLTLVVSLALVMTATTAIYHRAWERLTPLEPTHGATRLTQSNPVTFRSYFDTWTVRLPDGRAWTDRISMFVPNLFAMLTDGLKTTELFGGGRFLDGTNWVSVVTCGFDTVGIQLDGSLWVTEQPKTFSPFMRLPRRVFDNVPELTKLLKFGNDSDWRNVAGYYRFAFLLKNDGTLWRWGTNNFDLKHNKWPGLQAFTPYRLGTESNWAEIFSLESMTFLRKTDGSVWIFNYEIKTGGGEKLEQKIKLEPGVVIQRAARLEAGRLLASTTAWSRYGMAYQVVIRSDGTFRIWADRKLNNQPHSYEWTEADLQFGKDTNWLGVAGRGVKIVTLKNDGTLWLWNFYQNNRRGWNLEHDEREMLDVKPVRLGTHSDWIAVTGADGGIISLAADGSLWFWRFKPNYSYVSHDIAFVPLLDISRKPQRIAGIFDKAN
jgi:alpha-tubulin suppressor-like RCC1 family protein